MVLDNMYSIQFIKNHVELVDKRNVFLSDKKDENSLNCIVFKVKIMLVTPNVWVLIYYHGYFLVIVAYIWGVLVYDHFKILY